MDNQVEILLVEDNPDDVELALHALRRNNLANKIHVVRDGAEALDFLLSGEHHNEHSLFKLPKVILLDLKLPKVDGLEVLRQIRKNRRTRFIPVVMLTSSDQEADIVESYQLGVNSFIRKPVDFEKFTEAIRQIGFYWLILNQPPSA